MRNIKNFSPVFFQELDCALVLLLLNQDLRLVKNNLRVLIVRVVVSAALSIGFILSLKKSVHKFIQVLVHSAVNESVL